MAPNDITGAELVIKWTPDSGPLAGQTITLSTFGMEFSAESTANIIRTTSFSEAQAAGRRHTKMAGLSDAKGSYKFKYQRGDRTTFNSLAEGTSGSFVIYDEGEVSGKTIETCYAIIAKRGREFKIDELLMVSCDIEFSGASVFTIVP